MYTNKKYPGKSLFEKGKTLFNDAMKVRENLALFNWLIDNELELLEWNQDIESPINFFENQREIFDKALEICNKCESNKDYLDEKMQESLNSINKIINNPIPYREIRKITSLVDEIELGFVEKVKEKRKEALELVNSDYDYLKLRSSQYGVSHITKDRLINDFNQIISGIEELQDIYRIDAKVAQSTQKRRYFEEIISKDIKETEEKDKKLIDTTIINETPVEEEEKYPNSNQVEKPKKEVQKVNMNNLIDITNIKTEDDVDIYLKALAIKLKDIIRNNKEIEIEK